MGKLKYVSIRLDEDTLKQIDKIKANEGESRSDVIRQLIKNGLEERVLEENTDLIAKLVRQQMEVVIKPHIERLAALSSKGGHMSATATFLNVQALMDLVPNDKRKDVLAMYEDARKKAVAYMRTSTSNLERE